MRKDIRDKLIELARLRTTWSYSQLNEQLELGLKFTKNGADNRLIGDWLDEISRFEYSRKRPILSCLITHKLIPREQGNGFYTLCSELLNRKSDDLKKDKEWENQLIVKCYEFWLDPDNFKNYKNDCY